MYPVTATTALAVLTLFVVTATSAPAPERPEATYLATRVGAKWVYHHAGRTITKVVEKVEEVRGTTVVTVSCHGHPNKLVGHEKLSVSRDGLYLLESSEGVIKVTHNNCLLRLPFHDGATWKEKLHLPIGEPGTYASYGPELVQVPAGSYRAVRAVFRSAEGRGGPLVHWYAPDVGLVKWAVGDLVTELVSFEPGKK